MDRNSIVGLLLIGAILIGYSYWNQPTAEEIAAMKDQARQDSLTQVEAENLASKADAETAKIQETNAAVSAEDSAALAQLDSLNKMKQLAKYGTLVNAAEGTEELHVLENEKIKFTTSTKGGAPVQAELKDYVTSDSLPLYVFSKDHSNFNFNFWLDKSTEVRTGELFWEAVAGEMSTSKAVYRLYKLGRQEYIQVTYSLDAEQAQVVNTEVTVVGFSEMLREMDDHLEINWNITPPLHEKVRDREMEKTTVFYKLADEDADYISERNYEKIDFESTVQWVSFKQQYFSAAIISDGFSKDNASAEVIENKDPLYLKEMQTTLGLPLKGSEPTGNFKFYVGPNHYQTLSGLDIGLEDQIDLGWPIISWVNTLIVIPVFNFLDNNTGLSYGIIILLLTLFIKTLLFPITWKNYVSSARMKVLKPEVDEINKKFGDKDPMAKQQAVMGLYRQAGVNPLAGCIPALLQMPILYAMFRFFPASIELRQESFLWATDLSTYDSIFQLPFDIPFYGDHVSLFTILMAISTFLYTKYNMNMSSGMGGAQEAQMKIIMYFMPVMLLVFFNNYAAGLSYYYFIANIISVGQQLVIKKYFINEEKIHAKIQANKAKPKKKSAFQQRLEDMAKQRGLQ